MKTCEKRVDRLMISLLDLPYNDQHIYEPAAGMAPLSGRKDREDRHGLDPGHGDAG